MSNEESPKYPAEFEMLEGTGSAIRQFRQKVVGGWLVLSAIDNTSSTVFLPDPNHEWDAPVKRSRKRSDFF